MRDAAFIVSAEVIRREYDEIKEGSSVQKQDPWSFWSEYRVQQNYKGTMKIGQTVRVVQKSNTCLPRDYKIQRKNSQLVSSYSEKGRVQEESLNGWDRGVEKGAKVFLFLDASKNHYGWFISPSYWSRETETQLKTKLR